MGRPGRTWAGRSGAGPADGLRAGSTVAKVDAIGFVMHGCSDPWGVSPTACGCRHGMPCVTRQVPLLAAG